METEDFSGVVTVATVDSSVVTVVVTEDSLVVSQVVTGDSSVVIVDFYEPDVSTVVVVDFSDIASDSEDTQFHSKASEVVTDD